VGLPRINRLKHWRDFKLVYQNGLNWRSPHFTLWGLSQVNQNNQLQQQDSEGMRDFSPPPTQLGISISQKVSKKAVIRNRIKRQIQARFQELLPEIAPGWKLVLNVRPTITQCESEHFLQELKQLLIKAEVIHGH
jgi:ribonuclease P protein component